MEGFLPRLDWVDNDGDVYMKAVGGVIFIREAYNSFLSF